MIITMGHIERVLACPMGPNDADAATVREYLVKLLALVWEQQDGFSGKRPFGNSGWDYEVYNALVTEGIVEGGFDGYGRVEWLDEERAQALVLAAIAELDA